MTSCATMAKETIDTLLGVNEESHVDLIGKPKMVHRNNEKQLAKNREQLKKEGKCPICSGMGRTPDGKYICETCKGTGKYIETNNK